MKRNNTLPIIYLLLMFIALGSLALTTVSAVRATPASESDEYVANMNMPYIGVSLQEGNAEEGKWTTVAYRNFDPDSETWDPERGVKGDPIFTGLKDVEFGVGDLFEDDFRVVNSGNIVEYVRVVVYKYWLDADGKEKDTSLDSSFIDLIYNEKGNWIKDEKYSTKEKEIWYYRMPLNVDEATDALITGLRLDGKIKEMYTVDKIEKQSEDGKYTTISYDYLYNGREFKVEMEVDGVQYKHGSDAILSAWGRANTIENDRLSLD